MTHPYGCALTYRAGFDPGKHTEYMKMTEEVKDKKDVVPSEYRDRYKATGGTNGDFIATALSKVGEDGVEALASVKRENGIDKDRWATFNPGMQRMNLANVLRGSFLKGETITILGKQYNAKHLAEDFNGEVKDDDKVLAKLADYLGLVAQGQGASDRVIAALRKLFFAPAKKTAEDRAAEKAKKDEAKASEKAEAKRVKDEAKAKAALQKAQDKTKAANDALDEANQALNVAIKANNEAEDKTKTTAAVNAAQKKADKAGEKVEAAEKVLAEAEAAVAALAPTEA